MRRLYALGCGGMLGDALYKYFSAKGDCVQASDINLTSDWQRWRDVRDYDGVNHDIHGLHPDCIINLAAITDMEVCEKDPQTALDTNMGGSAVCAALAIKYGLPYVYISTASVFDGTKESYHDWDCPNPHSVYARAKHWGELIARTVPQHLIMRCGWSMGSGPKDKKFIQKIWQQIKSGATELNVVEDKVGSPTYVKDFVKQMDVLLREELWGTYNVVCKGLASRYGVAKEFLRLLGLTNKVKLNAVPSSFWIKDFSAYRPPNECLISSGLDAYDLNVMSPWQDALADYVHEYADYFSVAHDS